MHELHKMQGNKYCINSAHILGSLIEWIHNPVK